MTFPSRFIQSPSFHFHAFARLWLIRVGESYCRMPHVPLADSALPTSRGPSPPGIHRELAERALRAAIWLAIDAADRCGDGESSDVLLGVYDRCVQRSVRDEQRRR